MGSSVTNCGLSGAGMSVKIINRSVDATWLCPVLDATIADVHLGLHVHLSFPSFVAGINQVALSEGLLLGSRLGLDSKVLSAALNASSGTSPLTRSQPPTSHPRTLAVHSRLTKQNYFLPV